MRHVLPGPAYRIAFATRFSTITRSMRGRRRRPRPPAAPAGLPRAGGQQRGPPPGAAARCRERCPPPRETRRALDPAPRRLPPLPHPFPFHRPVDVCPASIMTSMPKVLIVEDDEVIAQGMARHLGAAGFDAVWVANGDQGLARLRYEKPDACVLDLMLPGLDGWKLIETVRAEGIGTPIIVVSARGNEHDRVHALELGADDYLVKPVSMKELVARVKAALRRGLQSVERRDGEAVEVD